MDFQNLEGLIVEPDTLTIGNRQLRYSLYIEFANTKSLQKLYSNIITVFTKYIDENVLPENYDQDILYTFLKENKYESTMEDQGKMNVKVHVHSHPVFPIMNVAPSLKRAHQIVAKIDKIGYQHLYMLSKMIDTSESSNTNTSDSELGAGDAAPLKKKLKTCQKAIEVDCESMLQYHHENLTQIPETTVQVDILIFIDKLVCKQLSEYLGLIYVEGLLMEAEENDMHSLLLRLNNRNSKLYKLMQSYINKYLIKGCNNVCLVHTLQLWKNISANYRAVISNKNNRLVYVEPIDTTNVHVELGPNPSILQYVDAISSIVDNALCFESHVLAKYQCDKSSYYVVKLPLIAVVPLYILKYFAQCEIKKQMHK